MIDTRDKIVGVEQARQLAAEQNLRAVTGYFDPLLPAEVKQLRELARDGRPLLLVVKTPPDAYLEVRACAELAAALDFAGAVVIADEWPGAHALHEEEGAQRTAFIAYVRDRAVQKG